jgi:hypothetical protein
MGQSEDDSPGTGDDEQTAPTTIGYPNGVHPVADSCDQVIHFAPT